MADVSVEVAIGLNQGLFFRCRTLRLFIEVHQERTYPDSESEAALVYWRDAATTLSLEVAVRPQGLPGDLGFPNPCRPRLGQT